MDQQPKSFWQDFTERTGLKKDDKIMIGNSDSLETEFTTLNDLFGLFSFQQINPAVIQFHNSNNPTIDNYDLYFANDYGQLPTIKLFTIDEFDNLIPRTEQAIVIRSQGKITKVSFEFPIPADGFIKISK